MGIPARQLSCVERRGRYLLHPSPFVDSTCAPAYVLDLNDSFLTRPDESLELHFAAAYQFYEVLDHPYGFVTRLSQLRELKPTLRRKYAEHVNSAEKWALKYCRARAVVCDNPLQRGVATAVEWFLRTQIENRYFTDPDEALAWVRGRLPEW